MTEEEKGAPVWGEEPVKQSGEDEGLPGKAAPAAGAAAPEMGGDIPGGGSRPSGSGGRGPRKRGRGKPGRGCSGGPGSPGERRGRG